MTGLQHSIPSVAKKYLWDLKYAVLGYPHFVAPEDVLRYLSAQLNRNASVLDLGCGRGSLLVALRKLGWNGSYCGVDISKRAIVQAQASTDQRSSWAVSDFESFDSPFKWDMITMVESIYYIDLTKLPTVTQKLVDMLDAGGQLLFRVHDTAKHKKHMDLVLTQYPHTERIENNLFCIPAPVLLKHSITS